VPTERDAEDAEPRLMARPRRTRYNRRIRCAVRDVVSADPLLVRGTAHGTPLAMKALPPTIETFGLLAAG